MTLATKSNRNRVVIPDYEVDTRTVWVKNISSGTSPALAQKMASSCGTVSVSSTKATQPTGCCYFPILVT